MSARVPAENQMRSFARVPLPFRAVNKRSSAQFQPGLQRHHVLPRQLLKQTYFKTMFGEIGRNAIGFDDFRTNGLLLPCREDTAVRLCLPLHRGPHRLYNEMVISRVGRIEEHWAGQRNVNAKRAATDALDSITLLQRALRRRLLDQKRRVVLNRKDPLGTGYDFAELDAMAQTLWDAT